MPPLQRFVVALTGGLQDSKAQPDPGDFVRLYNFSVFRGRFGIRAPVEQIQTIGAESSILDIKRHLDRVFILTYDSGADQVDLYSMPFLDPDSQWGVETHETLVYGSVTTRPQCKLTSFSGGSEDSQQDRLYIADFDQGQPTKYWIDATDTLVQAKEDLDANDTAEDLYFSLMAPYQFHLWGTGFYGGAGSNFRPEMLRFSQPGLIPNIDPAGGVDNLGGTPASKEWFSFSYRNLGRRGDRIQALSYAAGNMMVFQAGSIHALFGYGQDSWAAKQVSDQVGCVGPNAVVQAGSGGLCYFWSHDGPFATDGTTLQPMGEDIRQHVVDLQGDEKVSAAYAPDEGIIYFTVYARGVDVDGTIWPTEYLAFDVNRNKWAEGSWLDGNESDPFALQISCLETLTPREISSAAGPIGTPSGLAAYADGVWSYWDGAASCMTWTPGDTSTEVETVIHRDTSTGFTPGPTNEIARVESSVTFYCDEGLATLADFYYKVRHYRNGSYSSPSNEYAIRTPCPVLSSKPTLKTIPTGIEVTVDVPDATLDVEIFRQPAEVGGAGWISATTMTTPGTGLQTYNDAGGECGILYEYYAVTQKATEQDSGWMQSTRPATACNDGTTNTFTVTAGTTNVSVVRLGVLVNANCTYVNATRYTDVIESSVDKSDGEGYVDIETHPCLGVNSNVRRQFTANCPDDDSTWIVRWRALAGGQTLTNADSNAGVNPCGGVAV